MRSSRIRSVIVVRAPMRSQPSATRISRVELGDALDVDDGARPDRPVAEADDQVGAAGERSRIAVASASSASASASAVGRS